MNGIKSFKADLPYNTSYNSYKQSIILSIFISLIIFRLNNNDEMNYIFYLDIYVRMYILSFLLYCELG